MTESATVSESAVENHGESHSQEEKSKETVADPVKSEKTPSDQSAAGAKRKGKKKSKNKSERQGQHEMELNELRDLISKHKLFCRICVIAFNDLEDLREHRKGEEHLYHVARKEAMLVPGLGYCKPCHLVFPAKYTQHCESQQHKAAVEMLIALGEDEEGVDYSKPFGCTEKGIVGSQIEDKDLVVTTPRPAVNPVIGLAHITKQADTDHDYLCNLCNESFPYLVRTHHIQGTAHRLNYMKENYPSYHEECEKTKLKLRLRTLVIFYAHKVEEKETPEESEDVKKLRDFFYDPKISEAESQRIKSLGKKRKPKKEPKKAAQPAQRSNQKPQVKSGPVVKRPKMDGPQARGAGRGSRGGAPRGRGGTGGAPRGRSGTGTSWRDNSYHRPGYQSPPRYGSGPSYGPSSYGPPSYGPPSYGPPSYGPPSYGPSSYASPSYASPSYGPPSYDRGPTYRGGMPPHPRDLPPQQMTREELEREVLKARNQGGAGHHGASYQARYSGPPRAASRERAPPRQDSWSRTHSTSQQLPRGTGGWW